MDPAAERRSAQRLKRAGHDFADLVQTRERGRLKVYIGSAAGVGKSFRMLQEANDLKARGIDVVVAFIETHKRRETEAQLGSVELIPRRKTEYRSVMLEEMDVAAVIERRPAVAIVDELAHTNVPGSPHAKRWQDVEALRSEGINVISAVNVQHLESLNDVIAETLGLTVRETVPDWIVTEADQVVNLDISAEDLRQRMVDGKIYAAEKIPAALSNFFTEENLSTLRELALREVASNVDRLREATSYGAERKTQVTRRVDRILVAMASHTSLTTELLRKGSRIAGRLNSDWYCVYVQTPDERADRIDGTVQRHLVENIAKAQSIGAEVVTLRGENVADAICSFALAQAVSLIIVGQSRRRWWQHLTRASVVDRLINNSFGLDVLIVSPSGRTRSGREAKQ